METSLDSIGEMRKLDPITIDVHGLEDYEGAMLPDETANDKKPTMT
jgi:hypothetical protein